MKKEVTVQGKTVEAAVEAGALELGVSADKITYEVLTAPKKGFLGLGEVLASVRVTFEAKEPSDRALDFINTLIENMGIEADIEMENLNGDNDYLITIDGDDAGVLIGHHGETLDSLQYLANLAANKRDEDEDRQYTKISVDVGDYRAKREETLRALARRMAGKVKRYGKSFALEPMSPYERRIIHSEIQGIEGVTTGSVGSDNNRRVVIYLD